MGAASSLVISRAVALRQSLQRLAQKLLETLRRLARRPGTAPPEPQAAGADEDGPEHDAEGEDSEPSERRESGRTAAVPADSAAMRRPEGQAFGPAEPAARRPRPAPHSTRVGGDK